MAAYGGAGVSSAATGGAATDEKADGPWLHAWYDPVAGLKTLSQCVRLTDLNADGDYKLIVADQEKRMKVYKGTSVASSSTLLDIPVALATFYADASVPRIPAVAVAAGTFVFVYRNLRPYMKFTCPEIGVVAEETAAWDAFWAGKSDMDALVAALARVRDTATHVSARAADVLAMTDPTERTTYVNSTRGKPLTQQTVITCMDTINRDREGDKEISSLVVGTEAKQLLFLDPSCTTVELAIALPSVPTHLAVHGLYNVEYRVNVACRDGVVYAVKDKQLMATKIECGSLVCGLVRTEADLLVGTIDNKLHSYHVKGKRNWSVTMPAAITAMARLHIRKAEAWDCVGVALEGGEVRVYNGKSCVATLNCPDTITALRFGTYSREANTLVTVSRSGSLTFKMTKRTATFKAMEGAAGPPPEQDIPLPVPKKTKLYVEQTQRERDFAADMHRIFQQELRKLRLATARAFVKTIADGGSALATVSGASLRLNATVAGLGPSFKVKVDFTNVGSDAATDLTCFFAYNESMYVVPTAMIRIPMLVPGVRYQHEFVVICIDALGRADNIRCLVLRGSSPVPAINAIIAMPMSQPLPA